ncbi:MAG TPA: hypothetical protein VIL58_08410 [Thermoplasmata archaeon]
MPKGDAASLAEGYRTILGECLSQLDAASLVKLRGELQVVSRWLDVRKKADLKRDADVALGAVTQFCEFGFEIGGSAASRRSAETASFFDLASVGVLAVENVLTAETRTLMRFLMSGLSEGLMFLGSRQYVSGSDAVLQAAYRAHSLAVQDALWFLATDLRDPEGLDSIREVRAAIDALFAKFDEPGVPLGTKLALLQQLYGLVAIVRCAKLLEDLRDLA